MQVRKSHYHTAARECIKVILGGLLYRSLNMQQVSKGKERIAYLKKV